MAKWAPSALQVGRLAALVEAENVASLAVLERCGFLREGLLRRHREGPDGRRVDSVICGLSPEDLKC